MPSAVNPVPRSSCVKIYLCSNPEDSVSERGALRESVFPKLVEHCRRTLGLDVRVIDPFESNDPSRWPDESTRQQLINECRESSAGPFLLALVGHQYGAASLPKWVEVSEYQLLLHEAQKAGISTQELERMYQRDENSIPTSYRLPPRRVAGFQMEREEEVKRKAKEDELLKVFQTTASLCVKRGLMTADRAMRYYRSAMDADLRFALQQRREGDIARRCVVYIHNVINAKGQRPKTPIRETTAPLEDLGTAPSDGPPLSELCDNFLPGLTNSSQILVYTTTTVCDHRHGYTTARRKGYVESLCRQAHNDLVALIGCSNASETGDEAQECDALDREDTELEGACGIISRFYDVVRPEEEKVRHYVEQSEQQCPLVVTGGPCTGKAVLLAHCAQQIKSWLPDSDPVVLTYFCQLSTSLSPKQLLSSLCHRILRRYKHNASSLKQTLDNQSGCSCAEYRDKDATLNVPSNLDLHRKLSSTEATSDCQRNPNLIPFGITELQKKFSSILSVVPSKQRPLFLILDGLDHVESDFGSQILRCLTSPLPPNVKVILSVASSRRQILQALDPAPPRDGPLDPNGKESVYTSVPLGAADRKQCVKMLASLLSSSGRKVTSGQQALVNQALTSCCLTLYVRLLHLHASLWNSDSDVTESCLPDGVHSSITALLDHLEQKHGPAVVDRAVSYLVLSRTGLTEAELADLLSSDDRVLSGYLRQGEKAPPAMKVPQVDVEMLLLDMRRFLLQRTVTGLQVLSWASRHFKLVVTKRYLFTLEARKEIHSSMADYFSSRWSHGKAKPLLISQRSLSKDEDVQIIIYIDRQPSSQPLDFPNSSEEHSRVNTRKVLELPHHLRESENWEEMEREVLMSFRFHQAVIQAGLLGDLVAMLESEEGPDHSHKRERAFLTSIFKSYACFLQTSPRQLPTVMEANLLPYLEVFPALNAYINDIRLQRRERESGVGVEICPAPSSVPPVGCLEFDGGDASVSVTEVAATDCGTIAQVMDDGTAWFWFGPGSDLARLSLTSEERELRFTGVKSSAGFVLLSTLCDRLFFWDAKGPETFAPLREAKQAPTKIEGFVACRRKLFTRRKNESSVNMFDIPDETATHLQCPSVVTCFACSSDGSSLYCGQEEGTVTLFETDRGSVLATWSSSNQETISWMSLSKETGEVACGDKAGSIAIWGAADHTRSPRSIKEGSPGDEFKEVLNTDCFHDGHTLLVCQSRRVSLWDTRNWVLRDQFSAPQGKLFVCAMLSQNGDLILALVDACPFILAWRVNGGECVLSLRLNKQPCALLKTDSDVICVDPEARLTWWGSASVDAAGGAPKMGRAVTEVAVELSGRHFYTADGSQAVWRWQVGTGLPRAHVLHEGPVGKLRLSPDGLHLVTISAGDVYVWDTETGQNIVRVGGSEATDVLVTPNGNFGVSFSEQRLSQVWNLTRGSVACSVRLHLSDARVSPESTFLIGRHRGDLLAASLWSGLISKRFSRAAGREPVAAFHTLAEHPNMVVVMAESGALYTWNIAAETVCRHFQLPYMLHCGPRDFQMSSDGSYALLSTKNETVTVLDLSQVIICSLKTEGPVVQACLDRAGRYITYISAPPTRKKNCLLHAKPLLTVVQLSDGKRTGSVLLPTRPMTLHVCEQHRVFVGFEDGSVGVYCISDATVSGEVSEENRGKKRPLDRWLPLSMPNVKWL